MSSFSICFLLGLSAGFGGFLYWLIDNHINRYGFIHDTYYLLDTGDVIYIHQIAPKGTHITNWLGCDVAYMINNLKNIKYSDRKSVFKFLILYNATLIDQVQATRRIKEIEHKLKNI